ncbi:MAG: FAD-linked oxidase C-terminal domain-containing protein, partial [Casimicrobiaceae bacterium]
LSAPEGAAATAFMQHAGAVNAIVHDHVARHAGSFSAEHGIGQLKREDLIHYKSAVELRMMRAIKATLDPRNLMNPGKVL